MSFLSSRWRFMPVVLSMALIFLASHQPGDAIEFIDIPNIDKLAHSVVYAVLGMSVLVAVTPGLRRDHPFAVSLLVILFCLVYGVSDEFHQSFVPGRFPSFWDLVADTLGGVLAALCWYRLAEPRLK